MNKDKLNKLGAYTDSLLTLLIRAYSQYLFLRPMMFHTGLISRYADPQKRFGFEHLRHVLYRILILEVAKLCDDADARSPSIAGMRAELANPDVRRLLENEYCRPDWPRIPGDTEATFRVRQTDDITRAKLRFGKSYSSFMAGSETLLASVEFLGLKQARDSQLAHNELTFIDGKYHFVDAKDLKYGHERKVLEALRPLIEDLTSIVHQSSFSWNSFYDPEVQGVCAFWEIDSLGDIIHS